MKPIDTLNKRIAELESASSPSEKEAHEYMLCLALRERYGESLEIHHLSEITEMARHLIGFKLDLEARMVAAAEKAAV